MWAESKQMDWSARAYHSILKLARTIGDLTGSENIQSAQPAKVLQYHPKIIMGEIFQKREFCI